MRVSILKSKLRNNKKGNMILDGSLVLVVLFVFALILIYGFSLFNEINDEMQSEEDLSDMSKDLMTEKVAEYPSLFDGLYAVVIIVLWATVMIASFFIDAHPIFWIFTVLLSIFLIIGAGMLSNIFEETMTDVAFASYTTSFPITYYTATHLVEFIIAIVLSIGLALFGKWRFGQ